MLKTGIATMEERMLNSDCFNPEHVLLRTLAESVANAGESGARKFMRNQEFDVVCSGGGMRGFFYTGANIVLQQLVRNYGWKLHRFAGTSAGAWTAVYLALGMDTVKWTESFYIYQEHLRTKDPLTVTDDDSDYMKFVRSVLPNDCHERCSDRVFIGITEVGCCSLKKRVVSKFTSKEDLIACCIAAGNIPYMSTKGKGKPYRGMTAWDGGFTDNLPLFEDGLRRQLVFDVFAKNGAMADYNLSMTSAPKDPAIESIIMRGAFEMRAFACSGNNESDPFKAIHTIHIREAHEKREKTLLQRLCICCS